MTRDLVLFSPRLSLTSWLIADVEDLFEVHRDPETMRFVRHGRAETRAETHELIAAYMAEQELRGWIKWRLVDSDGDMIGRAGFGWTDARRGLSYLIRRSHWGRGLATEIAAALVEWHHSHRHRLVLVAGPVISYT